MLVEAYIFGSNAASAKPLLKYTSADTAVK
jgi:hypothetical protein